MATSAASLSGVLPTRPRSENQSPVLPASTAANGTSPSTAGVGGKLYTLEEWDALYPIPEPALQSPGQNGNGSGITPLPSAQSDGELMKKFNHLYQLHQMVPVFTFDEVSKGCFTAKLEIGGHLFTLDGPFPSKKQAKEAAARRAFAIFENIEPPKGKRKEQKKRHPDSEERNEENWIGLLVEYAQKHRHLPPQFQFFEATMHSEQRLGLSNNPKQFACTLRIEARSDYAFGSEDRLTSSKAEAKRLAAREAVLWLRDAGLVKESSVTKQPSKRRKSVQDEHHGGSTRSITKLDPGQSPAQRVVEYSLQLGFTQPRYESAACTPPPGSCVGSSFYTVAAHYSEQDIEREPRLKGPLCQTPAVFGQKRAKDMCSRALVDLLESLFV